MKAESLLRKSREASSLEGTTLVVKANPPVTMTLGVRCACEFFLGPH